MQRTFSSLPRREREARKLGAFDEGQSEAYTMANRNKLLKSNSATAQNFYPFGNAAAKFVPFSADALTSRKFGEKDAYHPGTWLMLYPSSRAQHLQPSSELALLNGASDQLTGERPPMHWLL